MSLLPPACLVLLLLAACSEPVRPARPHVLLISLDTLRADHLGLYGYERDTSPVLDAFAQNAFVFSEAYSQSNKTAPSHMSLMTGLLPQAHGVFNLAESGNRRLSDRVPTLARLLSEHGYATAAFTGGGHLSPTLGFDDGFDVYEGPGSWEDNVAATLEVFEDRGDEPVFVFLHTYEIHDPYLPPQAFRSRWLDEEYAGRVTFTRESLAPVGDWERVHEMFWSRVDRQSTSDVQRVVDLYDSGIRYTDDVLARLFAGLEEMGVADDTLVLVVSDHGEEFKEHGRFLHNSLHREVLHVPLIIALPEPDAGPGRRIEQPVQLVDVLPTLLDLLDLPPAAGVQGRSLVPLLRGDRLQPVDVSAHWPLTGESALRHDEWKLIRRPSREGGMVEELYQIADDPAELSDLHAEHPDVRAELAERLDQLKAVSIAIQQSREQGRQVVLNEETRAALMALGYLGGGN